MSWNVVLRLYQQYMSVLWDANMLISTKHHEPNNLPFMVIGHLPDVVAMVIGAHTINNTEGHTGLDRQWG